jgi:hypothetical protein
LRSKSPWFFALCALLLISVQPAHAAVHKAASSAAHNRSKHRHYRKGSWKRHGQQKIDSDRATEIQEALIREKYLDGEPSGAWDQKTKDAMSRYQADHGWQTKMLPDSRALISLGLGPKHENLLNPESLNQPGPTTPAVNGDQTRALQLVQNNNKNKN